jgi:mannose-6-phosphate isomerase-like protein (cupin superfamily)
MSSLKIGGIGVTDLSTIESVFMKFNPLVLVSTSTASGEPYETRTLVQNVGVIPPTMHNKILEIIFLHPGLYEPHIHENTSAMLVVVVGKGIAIIGESQSDYKPGDKLYVPSGVIHGFMVIEPTMMLSFTDNPIVNQSTGEHDYKPTG